MESNENLQYIVPKISEKPERNPGNGEYYSSLAI
jgi:hypothetical protein